MIALQVELAHFTILEFLLDSQLLLTSAHLAVGIRENA